MGLFGSVLKGVGSVVSDAAHEVTSVAEQGIALGEDIGKEAADVAISAAKDVAGRAIHLTAEQAMGVISAGIKNVETEYFTTFSAFRLMSKDIGDAGSLADSLFSIGLSAAGMDLLADKKLSKKHKKSAHKAIAIHPKASFDEVKKELDANPELHKKFEKRKKELDSL